MDSETKQGTVVFLKANSGSKSECCLPHLYVGKDTPILQLFMKNDNPFENKALLPYDGVRVRVEGCVGRNNDFIISRIETI